ncbi:MAG: hypothetical protein CVV24_13455 [Ignavibacteriae bacterium HGW-Ignavibacteriae-3]|nr:MAG: hypothetical protein CVV24_13455 [Ignavibacteriae bacterium HGW-Ignavibacteriae-3]
MIVIKKLALISFGMLILFSLHGCKSDDGPTDPESSSLVGTWVLTKISIPSGTGSIVLTPEQAQISSTIIARADGTYTATVVNLGVTTNESGTYSTSGNKITFVLQDGTIRATDYSRTGNKLVIRETIETPFAAETPADLEFTRQ